MDKEARQAADDAVTNLKLEADANQAIANSLRNDPTPEELRSMADRLEQGAKAIKDSLKVKVDDAPDKKASAGTGSSATP